LTTKYEIFEKASHTEQVIQSLSLRGVLEMCALCTNACSKSFKPLFYSHVGDVLVKTAPDLISHCFSSTMLWMSIQ